MEQRSAEWFADRCGKITASCLGDLMARTRTGAAASRKNLRARLIAERMTGQPQSTFSNAAMQWGTDTEPQARAAFEFETGDTVELVGSINHPTIPRTSASPDGLVGDDGLVEIKCPNTATHIDTLLSRKIPRKYIYQMQWQMACTGRNWCEFVSFDPRMPAHLEMWRKMVLRDNEMIEELASEIKKLDAEIEEIIARLNDRYRVAA